MYFNIVQFIKSYLTIITSTTRPIMHLYSDVSVSISEAMIYMDCRTTYTLNPTYNDPYCLDYPNSGWLLQSELIFTAALLNCQAERVHISIKTVQVSS